MGGEPKDKDKDKDQVSGPFNAAQASPAEFAKIPLDFIIASPLLTTIEAHKQAAMTTLDFIKSLQAGEPMKFSYKEKIDDNGTIREVDREISVPLIALTKVPSLNFDSLSVSFQYNISQVVEENNESKKSLAAEIGTKGILSKFLSASLTGSISNSSSRENTVNRGGTLDVKLHVSESPLPAGLQKVIDAMVEGLEAQDVKK